MPYFTQHTSHSRGVALLISILVVGIVLAIGLAILNLTLKQYVLSSVGEDSSIALYAADAGIECGKYWERSPTDGGAFDGGDVSVRCMGALVDVEHDSGGSTDTYTFEDITWGDAQGLCTNIQVIKYEGPINMTNDRRCPDGFTCTAIESRGYNRACGDLDNPRTVERALRAFYGGCLIGVNCPSD